MITGLFIQLGLMVVPALLLVGLLMREGKAREQSGEKKPVKELLLRSPGESLRRKIDELNDGIDINLINSIAIGAVAGLVLNQDFQQGGSGMVTKMVVHALVFLGAEWWVLSGIYRRIKERRNYRLGLSGELAVGEELNRLMLDGCHVFHDFPGGPDWNIDHIVVAPGGVFAIETKAVSKSKSLKKWQKDHEVIYTGETLEFPGWTTKEPIEQAHRNARDLAKFLTQSTAGTRAVYPLIIPIGWYVIPKVRPPYEVLHLDWVRPAILNRPRILSDDQIKRICFQIEQKCRDVEF